VDAPRAGAAGPPAKLAVDALRAKVGQLSHLPTLSTFAARAMAVARDPHSTSLLATHVARAKPLAEFAEAAITEAVRESAERFSAAGLASTRPSRSL
jgi:hypothetical protein